MCHFSLFYNCLVRVIIKPNYVTTTDNVCFAAQPKTTCWKIQCNLLKLRTGFFIYLCFERVIGDFGGVAKKMWRVYIYSDGITSPVAGIKNFSGSLKSWQKVERVRSENSAGLASAGVLLRGVKLYDSKFFSLKFLCEKFENSLEISEKLRDFSLS